MSEPVTKHRPTVDLDDFERRMRLSSQGRPTDPLADLARLVGQQPDPYGDVFAREAGSEPTTHDHAAAPDDIRQHDGRREPDFGAQPRLAGNFASIEAGLRGAIAPHGAPADAPYYGETHHAYEPDAAAYPPPSPADDWNDRQAYAPAAAPRSRKPLYMIAATIAIGVIGIGTAFALKSHIGSSPREIKTIMADAGPAKIQPPADTTSDQSGADGAMLGGSNSSAPTKLVSREEQPVDLSQAVQDNAARNAAANGSDASSVPLPQSPGQASGDQASAAPAGSVSQTQSMASDVTPKHVKAMPVRLDGTPIEGDGASSAMPEAASAPAPRQSASRTSDRAGPVAKAALPKSTTRVVSTPKMPKPTTPKTTAPKTIASLSGDDAASPAKPPRKSKPQRVASADTGDQEATEAVSPKPSAGNGGFAVQLAAPGSEAEAKTVSSKLGKKFADALGDHRLGFHKAQSNGKSVFRVRVGSLSKDEAVSLCEKLKADGGSCFVAKN